MNTPRLVHGLSFSLRCCLGGGEEGVVHFRMQEMQGPRGVEGRGGGKEVGGGVE